MENTCFLKSNRPGVSWTSGCVGQCTAQHYQPLGAAAGASVTCRLCHVRDHLDCLSKEKREVLGRETS